jgi:hypothetical protein
MLCVSAMRTSVGMIGVLAACGGCSAASSGIPGSGSASKNDPGSTISTAPCDPLAGPPTTLAMILGVGKDANSVFYVGDVAPSGQDRVFVSHGTTLERKYVAGSGGTGSGNAEYTFSFGDSPSDVAGLQALLIQTSGGKATAMALGPGNSRAFLGAGSGQVPLTVVSPSEVASLAVQNLPNVVQHVADVSDGTTIVVVTPMEPYGTADFRLFYGKANTMIEYPIVSVNSDDYGEYISFHIGKTTYNVFFNDPFEIDGGNGPQPGSLYTGTSAGDPAFETPTGALTVIERSPTPTTLTGFSFTCRGL